MPRTAARILTGVAVLAVTLAAAHGAERVAGVVRAAEAVYLRRGPGTEYPAFATLLRGAEVEVQGITGAWAAVRTASGERGYVHVAFLDLPAGATLPHVTPPGPAATIPPSATASGASSGAAAPEGTAQARPEEEIAAPRPQLARPSPTAAGRVEAAAPTDDVRADLQRLLHLTEELHRHVVQQSAQSPPAGVPVPASEAPGVAATLALAGAGLLVGFLIGAAYGRRQERGQRTRVRF